MHKHLITHVIMTLFILAGAITQAQGQQGQLTPMRSIEKIKGDLYRAQNNQHYNVVLVTDEGIIISDPIDESYALWLKEELHKRFGKPVKYVLYSHHHWDHASGGDVFKDTATFIGHENMPAHLTQPYSDPKDANVRKPDVVYQDKLVVSLGGQTVEMHYTGKNHTDDMSILYFPVEKAVYIVDFINVKRMPYRSMSGFYPDWFDSMKVVEAMDFNIFIPGHGNVGTKQDAIDHRQYIEELMAAVSLGMKQGKSVEQLQKTISMAAYKDWAGFERMLGENIAGMYEILKGQ